MRFAGICLVEKTEQKFRRIRACLIIIIIIIKRLNSQLRNYNSNDYE